VDEQKNAYELRENNEPVPPFQKIGGKRIAMTTPCKLTSICKRGGMARAHVRTQVRLMARSMYDNEFL
jgi:hypothetical protein